MNLVLKVDGDGYPHVGGVRWSGEELLHNYYDSLRYDESNNTYTYEFDKQKAEVQAFDELAVITDLQDKEATLLGNYSAELVSPLLLDFKSRPICYVECNQTVIRALVSTSAYYEYLKDAQISEEIPYWWEVEGVVQEREEQQYAVLMGDLVKTTSEFLRTHISMIPPKSSWVFHPLKLEEDVRFIAHLGHRILCCEPQNDHFKMRLKKDEELLSKIEQGQIEYFNEQFAPGDRTFDVFFDHGLLSHVYPSDRSNFFEYILSFKPKIFFGTIVLGHDFVGPPYSFTEREILERLKQISLEPMAWHRKGSFLHVLAKQV